MSILQFSAIALRAKIHKDGTETEKRLASLLFDEAIQVLSTFEMNQIASLSYGDEPSEQIFDLLGEIMAHPLEFSVLAVQKSLVITKHLLIYGSEKCVNSCWGLGLYIEKLCEFNTVLLAQQQQGLGSWWTSVKGGAVDKGFPIRECAQDLHTILADANRIQQLRHDNADPNSLVPVGSTDKLAFVSDDVRHFMLQKRMKEQGLLLTRSNLKKDVGGFGSGFNSVSGQTVVGAAHSLEEMIARAEREERKFSETGPVHYKPKAVHQQVQPTKEPEGAGIVDLLDFNAPPVVPPEPAVDLLDFGAVAHSPMPSLDIFATTALVVQDDLLGVTARPAANADIFGDDLLASPQPTIEETHDLINIMTLSEQSKATDPSKQELAVNPIDGLFTATALVRTRSLMTDTKPPVMISNADRFSALDELASTDGQLQSQPFTHSQPTTVPTPLHATSAFPTFMGDLGMIPTADTLGSMGSATMLSPPPQPTHLDDALEMAPMGGEAVWGVASGGRIGHGAFLSSPPLPLHPSPITYAGDFRSVAPHPPPFPPPPPPPSELPPPPPPDEPNTLTLAAKFGDVNDEDSGFYMGGGSGAGL